MLDLLSSALMIATRQNAWDKTRQMQDGRTAPQNQARHLWLPYSGSGN